VTANSKKNSGGFQSKATTSIFYEAPSKNNPYVASTRYLHGYDLFQLIQKRSYVEVLFLLFQAELPTVEQVKIIETIMVACMNPGPRHPAVRAAMNAGVSKSNHEHILPIGLMVLGGAEQGSTEVERAIHFLLENSSNTPEQTAKLLSLKPKTEEGDWRIAPGFGSIYGEIDPQVDELANYLAQLSGTGKNLSWGQQFVESIREQKVGWLISGLVAAVLADLGFGAREAAGMFQLISSPGILAHGLEQTHKPIFAMPLLEDENYVVKSEK